MTERSFPFDGGSGAIVTESDWGTMASQWLDRGLVDGAPHSKVSTLLQVTNDGTANTLKISPGAYWLDGFYYVNDSTATLTFPTNEDSQPRIDRVILRLDRNSNTIQLATIQGIPNSLPIAPSVTNNATITEASIATYRVNAVSSLPTQITATTTPVGRRVRIVTSVTDIPWGGIGYNTSDDTFYMVQSNGTTVAIPTTSGSNDFRIVTNSTKPTGGAAYDGLTVFETDTRRLWTYNSAASTYIAPAGVGFFRYKSADSGTLSGAGTTTDPNLFYSVYTQGVWRFSGEIYYSSNTAAATCTLSATGPSFVNFMRGVFRHPGTATNVVSTTTDVFSSGASIATPVAGTIYACQFDFLVSSATEGEDFALRTNNYSSSSQWQIRKGSYLRVEKVG